MGALGDPYIDVTALKAYLKIPSNSMDGLLENAVQSASNSIETYCGRQFNRTEEVSTRVYTPYTTGAVYVDDFWTTEGLVISTDISGLGIAPNTYRLFPANGVISGQVGWPYYGIKARTGTSTRFVMDDESIQVTAKWGWQAVPDSIKQACFILATETFKMKDAPFGVAGHDEFGTIRVKHNPMVENMLRKYRRNRLLVG